MRNAYYSLNQYCHDTYGKKLYKLSIDGGFTCPNRDGNKGTGGCIFCDADGSGRFTGNKIDGSGGYTLSIKGQLEREKQLIKSKLPKNGEYGYIAYFQAFTSTYGDPKKLRNLYLEAINDPKVCVLSIATRPDCLGKEVLDVIAEMTKIKPVWIELGLQTSNENSAIMINRCYENNEYQKAIFELKAIGVSHIITHVILGLPGENEVDMVDTVRFAIESGTDGIKLQLLHVLSGTKLAKMYEDGQFEVMTLEEYGELLKKLIKIIPNSVVVHRLTGDGDKRKLIAPLWSGDKKRVLNYINGLLN